MKTQWHQTGHRTHNSQHVWIHDHWLNFVICSFPSVCSEFVASHPAPTIKPQKNCCSSNIDAWCNSSVKDVGSWADSASTVSSDSTGENNPVTALKGWMCRFKMLVKSLQPGTVAGRQFKGNFPLLNSPVGSALTRPQESSGGLVLGHLIQGQTCTFENALSHLPSFFFSKTARLSENSQWD